MELRFFFLIRFPRSNHHSYNVCNGVQSMDKSILRPSATSHRRFFLCRTESSLFIGILSSYSNDVTIVKNVGDQWRSYSFRFSRRIFAKISSDARVPRADNFWRPSRWRWVIKCDQLEAEATLSVYEWFSGYVALHRPSIGLLMPISDRNVERYGTSIYP